MSEWPETAPRGIRTPIHPVPPAPPGTSVEPPTGDWHARQNASLAVRIANLHRLTWVVRAVLAWRMAGDPDRVNVQFRQAVHRAAEELRDVPPRAPRWLEADLSVFQKHIVRIAAEGFANPLHRAEVEQALVGDDRSLGDLVGPPVLRYVLVDGTVESLRDCDPAACLHLILDDLAATVDDPTAYRNAGVFSHKVATKLSALMRAAVEACGGEEPLPDDGWRSPFD